MLVPVMQLSHSGGLEVDLTAQGEDALQKLRNQNANLRKISEIPLKDGTTVADLWNRIKESVKGLGLHGPNFNESGGTPTTFPSYQFIMMLVEFLRINYGLKLEVQEDSAPVVRTLRPTLCHETATLRVPLL